MLGSVRRERLEHGSDAAVARCIEGQVRTWRFPPPDHGGNAVSVSIPFDLVRE